MNQIIAIFILTPLKAVVWGVGGIIGVIMGGGGAVYQGITGLFGGKKDPTTYGAASWAEPKEIKALFKGKGFYIGKMEGRRVFTGPESNMLLIATRGTGKSLTLGGAIRYSAHSKQKPDILINDPEGGLERLTATQLEAHGYRVITFNIVNPSQGVAWNPFSFLRRDLPYHYDRDIDTFLKLMMPDDANTSDDHWQDAARIVTIGVLRTLPPERQTLYHLAEHISTNSKALEEEYEKIVKRKVDHAIVRASANLFTAAGEREQGSFSTTITRKMMVMLRDSVRDATTFYQVNGRKTGHGWTFEDIYSDNVPTAIFIRCGLGADESFIARMAFGLAIKTRSRMWNDMGSRYEAITKADPRAKPAKPAFNRGLHLVIDEAHTLGNCYALVEAVEEQRKMGVNLFASYLSLDLLRKNLKNSITLISNCDIGVFGGFNERALAEELSRIFGPKTITTPSGGEDGVPLIRPDELMALDSRKIAVRMGGKNVLMDKSWRIKKNWLTGETDVIY